MPSDSSFLKPRGVDSSNLDTRRMKDGQFWNPPTFMDFGGFTSASKAKFDKNQMTMERGGPQAVRGRPI